MSQKIYNDSISFKKFRQLKVIGLMSRVFANGPGDRGSIPGQVIPKTQNYGT